MAHTSTISDNTKPILLLWRQVIVWLATVVSHDLIALGSRLSLAGIFLMSGRTKVTGIISVTDGAVSLFEEEYRLPLLDPTIAAHAAAYAEHLLPLLLVLGLGTRFAALGILGMTLVIQVFVYPNAWPTHLSWAVLSLYLISRGGGSWSADRMMAR